MVGPSDMSSSEEEDQDETSSFSSKKPLEEVDDALSNFREKWHKELASTSKELQQGGAPKLPDKTDDETEAKNLFLQGVQMEKTGKLYEAIQFYRRAVQLIPDIEFRLHSSAKNTSRERHLPSNEAELSNGENNDEDRDESTDEEELVDGELLPRIQKRFARMGALCVPKFQQKATHISALPMEMILNILRWVVSSDLDFRSLEMFSMVCRGFYLCARDSEIWRLACVKVWGLNCGVSPCNYLSWRDMFVERSRLHFNGCYIGKTSYLRHGENSFQDQFYKPWHLVVYYRYLRFFPDGIVLVLTSAEEPVQCVSQMKHRNACSPILRGYYRLTDDKVTLVVQREDSKYFLKKNKRRGRDERPPGQTFHMELEIKNNNKKRHVQLVWKSYSIFTRSMKGDESTCNFDLVNNRFPPFWFSRVKSYTSESESPLQ